MIFYKFMNLPIYACSKLKVPENERTQQMIKLGKNALYAWGFPFLITLFTYFVGQCQYLFGLIELPNPEIGYDRCWFNSKFNNTYII